MKKLRKLTRRQKELLVANGLDHMDYLLERQDHNSFTYAHRETKEKITLRYK